MEFVPKKNITKRTNKTMVKDIFSLIIAINN